MGFHSSANLDVMSLVVKGVVVAEEFLLATNQVSRLAYCWFHKRKNSVQLY